MELAVLQNLSPTLLGGMILAHTKDIEQGCKAFRCDDSCLEITFTLRDGEILRFYFEELPTEFRQAIHDYTTRLISEKNLMETILEDKMETAL